MDPRFDDMAGKYKDEVFKKRYAFIFDEQLPEEKTKLKKGLKVRIAEYRISNGGGRVQPYTISHALSCCYLRLNLWGTPKHRKLQHTALGLFTMGFMSEIVTCWQHVDADVPIQALVHPSCTDK
jgi:hypothetical protein